MKIPDINIDITLASTLPSSFYQSKECFDQMKEKIFASSWQLIESGENAQYPEEVFPFNLLPGFMNEPLLLVRNNSNKLSCLSNVCTHRGNILVDHPGKNKKLICNYHGRKFSLDGKFESMPEFGETKNFPLPCDDLHKVSAHQWNQFPFISLKPAFEIKSILDKMDERIGFLPVSQFRYASEFSREYLVNAHWAIYCDNYLEGFHIPFVHPDLNKILDYKNYSTEIYDYCNLQVGVSDESHECFELPKDHVDFGKNIAAYYFWLFPNMMFNFYPWGVSINIVKPMSEKQCKVSFITYIYDESKFDKGAGAMLDKVEREDEFVVENVQRGISSRFYESGRFSPTREKGVHQFHSLISKFMNA
ncbi:MAG: Rieske 2Fe-2S domain-containing protein [Bacteroidetes bacterium]|nr:Rieske 2Fe-2S domain-containing protein [Bacteroidota bacterium]